MKFPRYKEFLTEDFDSLLYAEKYFLKLFSYVAIKLFVELLSKLPCQLLKGEHNTVSFGSQFFQRTTVKQESKKITS